MDLISFMQKQQEALEKMGPKEELLQKKKSKRSSSLSEKKDVLSLQQHVTTGIEKMNLEFRDQTANFIPHPQSSSPSSSYPLSSSPSPSSATSSNLHHSSLFQSSPNLLSSSSASVIPNLLQSAPFSSSSPNLHQSPYKGERRRSKDKASSSSSTAQEDPSFSTGSPLTSPLSSSTLSLTSSAATSSSNLSLSSSSLNSSSLNLSHHTLPFPSASSSSPFSHRNPPPKFGQITPTYPSHPNSSGSSTASSPPASPFPADSGFPLFEEDENDVMGDLEQEEQWDKMGKPFYLPRRRSSTIESIGQSEPYSRGKISNSTSDPEGLSRYDRESNFLMERRNSNSRPRSRSRSPMLGPATNAPPSASKIPRFPVKRRLSLTAAHSSSSSSASSASSAVPHPNHHGYSGTAFTSSNPRRASLPELHAPVFGYSLKRSTSNSDGSFEDFLALNSRSSPSLSTLSTVPDAPEEWEEDLEAESVLPQDFIKEISSIILEHEHEHSLHLETPMSFLSSANLVQLNLAPLTPLNPSSSQYSELRCHADLFEDR